MKNSFIILILLISCNKFQNPKDDAICDMSKKLNDLENSYINNPDIP